MSDNNNKYLYEITLSNGVVADVYSDCKNVQEFILFNSMNDWIALDTVTEADVLEVIEVAYRVSHIISIKPLSLSDK